MKNVFLVLGAQKAGTTTLYKILEQHPEINCATKKETKFFIDEELYQRGLDYYQTSFFTPGKEELPYLDIDPGLLYFDFAPQRIYDALGENVKFIVVLRDPALRAYSHFTMERFRQKENLSFEDAVATEAERITTREGNLRHSYTSRGFYYRQIQRYLAYFPLENFRFFVFEEDLANNTATLVESLCSFMGINFDPQLSFEVKSNQSRAVRSELADQVLRNPNLLKSLIKQLIPLRLRRKLRPKMYQLNSVAKAAKTLPEEQRLSLIKNHFLEDIKQLEQLIGRDLSIWKNSPPQ